MEVLKSSGMLKVIMFAQSENIRQLWEQEKTKPDNQTRLRPPVPNGGEP
jgi:hypothetical protein